MVKGISKQVIVVHAPDEKLFEQAIFILKENAMGTGVTDEALLKEAKRAIGVRSQQKKKRWVSGPVWAFAGALATGVAWLVTALF